MAEDLEETDGVLTFERAFGSALARPTADEVRSVLVDDDVFVGVFTDEELAAVHAVVDPTEPLADFAEQAARVAELARDDRMVDAMLRSFVARGLVEVGEESEGEVEVELLGPLAIVGRSRIPGPLVTLVELHEKDEEETLAVTVHHLDEDVILEEAVDDGGFHAFVLRDVIGEALALANLLDPHRLAKGDGTPARFENAIATSELERLHDQNSAVLVVQTFVAGEEPPEGAPEPGTDDEADDISESLISFFSGDAGVTVASGYEVDGSTVLVSVGVGPDTLVDLLVDALLGLRRHDDDGSAAAIGAAN